MMKKTIIYISSIAIMLFVFSCRKTTGFVLKECGLDNTSGYTNFDSIGSTMFIPNGFTPNNNGLNDCWRVMGNRISPTGFSLEVKRRSKVLFSTTNLAESWNGTNKSGDCPGAGMYTYKVSATGKDGVKYNLEGDVTILLIGDKGKCLGTSDLSKLRFADQVDPAVGFVFNTQEAICNP